MGRRPGAQGVEHLRSHAPPGAYNTRLGTYVHVMFLRS